MEQLAPSTPQSDYLIGVNPKAKIYMILLFKKNLNKLFQLT